MRLKNLQLIVTACLLLMGAQSGWGFSLLGPEPPWQTTSLNFQQPGRDIGGWMDVGEEYRWNTPYITYGFDSSFLNYFGTNGVKAVEEAIAIFNALPPASEINLNEYPFESQRFNFQASANRMMDLKSAAMFYIIEHLGLANPEIGVWRVRDRWIQPAGVTNYAVIQLNFDPLAPYHRSSYINDVLYTYDTIIDSQDTVVGAFPRVIAVDPTASAAFSSVAGFNLNLGGFYTGLTRDDVGGLAYLLRSNNFNVEALLPDVRVVHTNLLNPVQLLTLDLAELLKQSQNTTNTVADLFATNAFYTNLWITGTNARPGALITTNRITYFTNYPANPQQVIEETYTTNLATLYSYEFGNVVIYDEQSERPIYVRILDVVPATNYDPYRPTVQTNVVEEYFDTEFIRNGEFYIMPTNLVRFVPEIFHSDAVLTNVTISTNVDFFAEAEFTIRTNTSQLELLLTTDLTTFFEQARTNDPASLLALYPDLLILSSNRYFTNVVSSNYVAYLTNSAWDPAIIFSIDHIWYFTTNIATNYSYVFGNVVTNFGDSSSVGSNATILVEETIVASDPYDPAGSPFTTNIISSLVITNVPVGNVYIVPTNLFGYHILSTQLVDVVSVTNTMVFTNVGPGAIEQTNTVSYIRNETNYFLNVFPIEFVSTNDLATNIFGIRRETYTFSTNRVFEVYPVELLAPTNTVALRPGVEKLNFVRVDYEALLGTNFNAITNEYIDTIITQTGIVQQVVCRTSSRPDIIFNVEDLGRFVNGNRTDTQSWDNNDAINGLEGHAGPGVITPSILAFNSSLPAYYNFTAGSFYIRDEVPPTLAWGSFDGSTNAPILYPEGTSLNLLEANVFSPVPTP